MRSGVKRAGQFFSTIGKWLYPYRYTIIIVSLLLGVFARFAVSTAGHNFDYESYLIIADITDRNGNVYAETHRYNYGPIWLTLLHIFDEIADFFRTNYQLVFRGLLVGFLTLIDILIAVILWRRFSYAAGAIFFLNPVSILITGYHNQFDNLAILAGLAGALLIDSASRLKAKNSRLKRIVWGSVVIGISLVIKHIFFLLPFWLALRLNGWRQKAIALFLPVAIFMVSFIPYLAGGHKGIIDNVFLYRSYANAPLLQFGLPDFLSTTIPPLLFFLLPMIILGLIFRKRKSFLEVTLWYLIFLVIFAQAIANQYLAIVMPAVAAFFHVAFIPYIVLAGTLLWAVSPNGPAFEQVAALLPQFLTDAVKPTAIRGALGMYHWIIVTLALGVVWYFFQNIIKQKIVQAYKWLVTELKTQLRLLKKE